MRLAGATPRTNISVALFNVQELQLVRICASF